MAPLKPRYTQDVFKELRDDIQGKNVAVIGHFPLIEELSNICTLSILERNPSPGDYPDSACEYILPQQDYIFITGTTFANKTLPRLLELGKNAKIVMTGPSVPLTPILFEYGVDILAGAIAAQTPQLWSAVEQKAGQSIFEHGAQMVQIEANAL